jgi:UDP-N-acetylmuramoyl-L-alanyl-D-glutamate--2,6-diaminopimelate ligase
MIQKLKNVYHLFIACIALFYFRFPGKHLTVIGVTGTDGKTTTTTLIYEILKNAGKKVSMITSVHAVIAGKEYDTGFHVTTPNAWYVQQYLRDAVDHGDRFMVLEVTSHALDQHRVFGIPFTVGVITNVTHEHLDFHKTFDTYLKTKLTLLKKSDIAIVNKDDKPVYVTVNQSIDLHHVIFYGIQSDADITPKTFSFKTKLPGIFNQYNCLAAISVAKELSIAPMTIKKTLAEFSGISGRMEVVYKGPFSVIVDFAHTPNALVQALRTVKPMTKGKLIHVFGSAGLRDRSKRPLMGKASSDYADVIVLTEEDYRTENVEKIMDEIQSGIEGEKDIHRFPDRHEAILFALSKAKKGDIVILTGKGHEKSLCRGTKEYPWSDQEEVKKILQNMSSKQSK